MKKLIGKTLFSVLGALLLGGCSGNTQPTTPKAKYFSTIKQLEKKCNEGLGTSRWCTVLAETSERPPSGIYPDAFKTSVYYGYAAYAAKRDCDKNIGDGCLNLGLLYKDGKGGLPENEKLAYKYHTKACGLPITKHSNFCKNLNKFYKDFLVKEERKETKRNEASRKAYIKQHPCSLSWLDTAYARAQCKYNTKVMVGNIGFSRCVQLELRKILRKQGCSKY